MCPRQGLNKEEVARLALAAARAVAAGGAGAEGGEPPALAAAAASLAELQLPDKLLRRAVAALLDFALSDEGRQTSSLLCSNYD